MQTSLTYAHTLLLHKPEKYLTFDIIYYMLPLRAINAHYSHFSRKMCLLYSTICCGTRLILSAYVTITSGIKRSSTRLSGNNISSSEHNCLVHIFWRLQLSPCFVLIYFLTLTIFWKIWSEIVMWFTDMMY